jgi:hypothetical protein
MRVAPVSADLLIKLAMLAGGVLVLAYVVRKVSTAASDAAGAAWDATSQAVRDGAWAVTPWNNNNVIYRGVNSTLFPDGSQTLGTWLYGATQDSRPENTGENWAFYVPSGWDVTPQGPNGPRYNNPSAYIAPVGAHSIYR